MKYIYSSLPVFFLICLLAPDIHAQADSTWKVNWTSTIEQLDSAFYPIQRHFRLMQTYQNEADEKLIWADIDSLNAFIPRINGVIEISNKLEMPFDTDGNNAAEAVKLKTLALREYFEQCLLQIQVNNRILQKKLKHESLDFKVSQLPDLMLNLKEFSRLKK